VKIRLQGNKLEIDGVDISQYVSSFELMQSAGSIAQLVLTLPVIPVQGGYVEAEDATVVMSPRVRKLLCFAGWVPPEDEKERFCRALQVESAAQVSVLTATSGGEEVRQAYFQGPDEGVASES